jgi:hypothetical protein
MNLAVSAHGAAKSQTARVADVLGTKNVLHCVLESLASVRGIDEEMTLDDV